MNRFLLGILIAFLPVFNLVADSGPEARPPTFRHPGLLHTQDDLDRIKTNVAHRVEPWKAGFARLKDHPQSKADWKMRGPFASVTRDPKGSLHNTEMWLDANAAYQNALMWAITGEAAHARKAIEILDGWSSTLTEIKGHDRQLAAGLYGFKYANAAEIMRSTYPQWPADKVARCQAMMRGTIYPAIEDFATFANGNWDTTCIATLMAIGVLCDDRAIFDRAVDYYHNGAGNGRLTHYIINDAGQCQESGRDQQHAQLGIAHLAEACEIAWNQGLDLYGAAGNRLLKGFEYTAKYNLGQPALFVPYTDRTGKYTAKAIAPQGRGRLRPIYEMAYHHYQNRRGLAAPFTQQAAEKLRPEGPAFQADHPGFGTLLFTRASAVADKAVSELAAHPPQAEISNDVLKVLVYLPDAQKGYYRGTRYDWSGVIGNLEYQGHRYYGPWFTKSDPAVDDILYRGPDLVAGPCSAITGPVEEFLTDDKALGYDDARPGETFIKIGVGILRRPREGGPYNRYRLHEIVDPGTWTVKTARDAIEFTQELSDRLSGYGYRYQKTIRLTPGRPELVMDHTLKNTGKRSIATSVYNHNFLVLDGQPPGPDFKLKMPFEIKVKRPPNSDLAEIRGNQIVYRKALRDKETVFTEFQGFGATAADHRFTIENKKAGAGLKIAGDRPLSKVALWSIRSVLCVEPFIAMTIEPGGEFTWKSTYTYYLIDRNAN